MTHPTKDQAEADSCFRTGDRVRKIKGYKFEGRVNGVFQYFDRPDAPNFVNVQHDDGWIMHFRESELELAQLQAPDAEVAATEWIDEQGFDFVGTGDDRSAAIDRKETIKSLTKLLHSRQPGVMLTEEEKRDVEAARKWDEEGTLELLEIIDRLTTQPTQKDG